MAERGVAAVQLERRAGFANMPETTRRRQLSAEAARLSSDAAEYLSEITGVRACAPATFVTRLMVERRGVYLGGLGTAFISHAAMVGDERRKLMTIGHEVTHHFEHALRGGRRTRNGGLVGMIDHAASEGKAGFIGAAYATLGENARMAGIIGLLRRAYGDAMPGTISDLGSAIAADIVEGGAASSFLRYYEGMRRNHGRHAGYAVGAALVVMRAMAESAEGEEPLLGLDIERFSGKLMEAQGAELVRQLYAAARRDVAGTGLKR